MVVNNRIVRAEYGVYYVSGSTGYYRDNIAGRIGTDSYKAYIGNVGNND
jgi:hypothetical protein